MQFRCISDSAAACDGGSLALLLVRIDGARTSLVLDRSIKSRGTPAFGTVRVDGLRVSGSAASELSTELQRLWESLSPDDRSKHPVSPFVEALSRQGAAPNPTQQPWSTSNPSTSDHDPPTRPRARSGVSSSALSEP